MADGYEDTYHDGEAWANYYAQEFAGPQYFSERTKAQTLYNWQNKDLTERCNVAIYTPGNNQRMRQIVKTLKAETVDGVHDEGSKVHFAIQGGADTPRFMIRLELIRGKSPVRMVALFPAWGRRGIDRDKLNAPIQIGSQLQMPPLDGSRTFTFSDSLNNVKFEQKQLPEEAKKAWNMPANTEHYTISFHSAVQPVCINFNASVSHLSPRQQNLAAVFRTLQREVNDCEVYIIPNRTPLGAKIAYIVNMPNPTPPFWPRYGSKFDKRKGHLLPLYVNDIPPLQGTEIGDQFAARVQNWRNMRPDNAAAFVGSSKGRRHDTYQAITLRGHGSQGQHDQRSLGQGYFLNERDYEAVRIVGLARDLQHAETTGANMFNKTYTFNLLPAGQSGAIGGLVNNDFYIFLNVRPTTHHGDVSGDIPPPIPGTRVVITMNTRENYQESREKAMKTPMMALDQSGWPESIVARNQSTLVSRRTGSTSVAASDVRSRGNSTASMQSQANSQSGMIPTSGGRRSLIGSPSGAWTEVMISQPSQSSTTSLQRKWHGVVVPRSGRQHDQHDICIFISTSDTGMSMGLQDCKGHFQFGNYHQAFKQVEQGIHLAMYGEGSFYKIPHDVSQNWLKKLLLSHENESLSRGPTGPDPSTVIYPESFQLEANQNQAFRRAISGWDQSDPMNLNARIVLVQGPPGTGKTKVASAIAHHSYQNRNSLLVSAGSNYAVDNLADAIFEILWPVRNTPHKWTNKKQEKMERVITDQAPNGIWGIYRLEKEDDEHYSNFGNAGASHATTDDHLVSVDEEALTFSLASQAVNQAIVGRGVSDEEYRTIEKWVGFRTTSGLRLSLGDQIRTRLLKARREGSSWVHDWAHSDDEYILLWYFLTQRIQLSRLGRAYVDIVGTTDATRMEIDDAMDQQARSLENASLAAWRSLQHFYLRHARIVLVTASTAGRKVLRGFQAQRVIIDEAAQLTEADSVNAIVRNYRNLWKVILIGDRKQLPPTVPSMKANEFCEEQKRSLMGRMEDTGVPVVLLNVQRRMDPEISIFPNTHFYHGRLSDHESVRNREPTQRFKQAMQSYLSQIGVANDANHSMWFVSVKDPLVYHRRGCTSFMNPVAMSVVIRTLQALHKKLKGFHRNGRKVTFAVLGYYAEEVQLLQRWIHQILKFDPEEIAVKNIDAAQGKEYDYVLLSTCRPGQGWGLGFVSDAQRMNFALTRAKHGLIIFGHRDMGKSADKAPSRRAGYKLWDDLVAHCNKQGCVLNASGNAATTATALGLVLNEWAQLAPNKNSTFDEE